MRIEIPYTPRYPDIHKRLESRRFTVLVAHRRFGKTVLAINHLLKMALLCPRPMGCYGYVGPLLKQTKKVAWAYLKSFTSNIPGRKVNEAETRIDLPNGASIWLYGADNPDSIRGSYFDGVVLDEVAQMKPQVWSEVIQPMLADRKGWALFIGTPKGVNLFSDLYYSALKREQEGNPHWQAMLYPVTATKALDQDEVDRLKEELSDNAFRQELLCDFSASSDDNLMQMDEVLAAMQREYDPVAAADWPLIIGVDVARFGDDATVFFCRQGYFAFEPAVFHKLDNVQIAHRLADYAIERKPEMICIDQGQGTGVIDLVREILRHSPQISIVEVPFGSKAMNPEKYANRRAEMWTRIRDYIRSGGKLPLSNQLMAELCAPTYSYDNMGRIKLEPKEEIKLRLDGKSTDLADALALTFAMKVESRNADQLARERKAAQSPYLIRQDDYAANSMDRYLA